jgi:hypothetical protein
MTISRKYTVIGSAAYKHAKYVADYDLNEFFNSSDKLSILHKIYLFFKQKFVEAEQDNTIFITDFKCGMDSDGDPLRWDKNDMKKGFKILKDKRKIAFEDCILMKTTMKLDVIALIDGVYTEFSDNYFIKLGDDANFFPTDISKNKILNSIKHSFDEYFYAAHNYMKGLKRCFAYYNIEGGNKSKMTTLFNFFNSPTGLLYVQRSEIGIIKTLLEQKFRKPNMTDVRRNIKLIGEKCEHFNFQSLEECLARAYKSKSLSDMNKFLDEASNELLKIINAQCLEFLKKNKSVLLY